MNRTTLKIPDGGLVLAGSAGDDASLPPQTFSLTLDPQIVQDMIRAAKESEDIQLSLGKTPVSFFLFIVAPSLPAGTREPRVISRHLGHMPRTLLRC